MRGRDLPVWGFPWQSNPYCRLELGTQAYNSKRQGETGGRGAFKNPTWDQEFHFLVEDAATQTVRITIYDSPYTGRTEVRAAELNTPGVHSCPLWGHWRRSRLALPTPRRCALPSLGRPRPDFAAYPAPHEKRARGARL